MNRPSKKEIKAAIDKLKDRSGPHAGGSPESNSGAPKPKSDKKTSMRIRKQGV